MGNPALVVDALTEVRDGRFGLLDDTDTCLVFEDHDRVRIAQDDALLASLRSQGFIELSPPRDTVSCLHGARRRPVTPLRLELGAAVTCCTAGHPSSPSPKEVPPMSAPDTARLARGLPVLVAAILGVIGAAAGFTHTHDWAMHHGQTGWLAWADAVVIEGMVVVAGFEVKRDHHATGTTRKVTFPLLVLVAGFGVQMAAQVALAEPTPAGWLVAAMPALGFLVVVKLLMRRAPEPTPTAAPPAVAPPPLPNPPAELAPVPTRPRLKLPPELTSRITTAAADRARRGPRAHHRGHPPRRPRPRRYGRPDPGRPHQPQRAPDHRLICRTTRAREHGHPTGHAPAPFLMRTKRKASPC